MTRRVQISEFKTHLIRLADEVSETGEEIVVTRRGRPLVRVLPASTPAPLAGSIEVLVPREELLAPLGEPWRAEH